MGVPRRFTRWCLGLLSLTIAASPASRDDDRRGMVVLQFDDGTVGHHTNAFPLLQKYGLKGSFGLVTGQLGRPGRLTGEQVDGAPQSSTYRQPIHRNR